VARSGPGRPVFAAESWDRTRSPAGWWGSRTDRVLLGTVPSCPRASTSCAMHALTLTTSLAGGRARAGVPSRRWWGLYGAPFGKPLARTRSTSRSSAGALRRRRSPSRGRTTRCLRRARPVGLASQLARSPTRCGLTCRSGWAPRVPRTCVTASCDGWLALFYSPRLGDTYRSGGRWPVPPGGAGAPATEFTRRPAVRWWSPTTRPARWSGSTLPGAVPGRMGRAGQNFHADVFSRMGYDEVVAEIGALFREGRRRNGCRCPANCRGHPIIGTVEQVRAGMARWSPPGGHAARRLAGRNAAGTLSHGCRSPCRRLNPF